MNHLIKLVPDSFRSLVEFPYNRKDIAANKTDVEKRDQLNQFVLTAFRTAAFVTTLIITNQFGFSLANKVLSIVALSFVSEGAAGMLMGSYIVSHGFSSLPALRSKAMISKAVIKPLLFLGLGYIKLKCSAKGPNGLVGRYLFHHLYEKRGDKFLGQQHLEEKCFG